jgi:hypothetical protein
MEIDKALRGAVSLMIFLAQLRKNSRIDLHTYAGVHSTASLSQTPGRALYLQLGVTRCREVTCVDSLISQIIFARA